MTGFIAPLRLRLDGQALARNWRTLSALSGQAACGAAVKADGYGLGARWAVRELAQAGCRDFFVATWGEAAALADMFADGALSLSVLHGVREEDMAIARGLPARPVIATARQAARWRDTGGGRCDAMIDTGMHRLGLGADELGMLDGLEVDVLMSHLASADEPGAALNAVQRGRLIDAAARVDARRTSLANSAGIALGPNYAFDLTRPGLALYGGVPCDALADQIVQVATPEAQILQRRRVPAGGTVGYNATWTAHRDTDIAILNLGYADGYKRAFSGLGAAMADGVRLPVLGRVSMDLTAIDVTAAPDLGEGDWVAMNYDLSEASAASGVSQYELLTGLGNRFERR
ncbi:alanine racemase [Sphingomonas sp.]